MPSLFVVRGNDQGVRLELDLDEIRLGRDVSNSLQIHDTEVSRRHARLIRTGKNYSVEDLGSSNGTFVNGERTTTHELASGDQIQIGSTLLLFTASGEEPPGDLSGKVDIVRQAAGEDRSRIIHTMPQVEGSRVFTPSRESVSQTETSWLARARSNLQVMYHTALAVSHTLDIDQLLNRILELIFEWVEADRGCVMLVDPESKQLEPRAHRTRAGRRGDERIAISKTILDYVTEKNEGVLTSDAREDQRWDTGASILNMGIREAICVPMQGRYTNVGVIYIDTSTAPHKMTEGSQTQKFTEEHLKLLVAIAHQAALAVEDTLYYGAMVQAERLAAVGQTIAVLSHHIKNILQGIRGGSFLIKEGLAQHDENMTRKGWEFVEKNQERISALVLDMLTFSKEREPEWIHADLNQVIHDVAELMQSRAAEHGVQLIVEPAPDMPELTFDPEGLHRAVLNVVTNAIDAAARDADENPRTDGRVTIRASLHRSEKLARVTVEDNGPGIASDDIAKIFSLFVSRKGGRGTGLGLPVSEKIMKEHGGRIRVESEVGQGSRFILELPTTHRLDDHADPAHSPITIELPEHSPGG